MEQKFPIIAKKVWNLMRVMFFMLKEGIISKTKFFNNLNMMERGKIAGKALNNLLFNHHHNWATATFLTPSSTEHEFGCSSSTTPQYPLSLFSTHNKQRTKQLKNDTPNDEVMINAAVMRALEMLTSATGSPALTGFGKSPMVKQLRITDSPFPLSNVDEDGKVDEAAEKFITRFYNDLRRQN